MSLLTHTPREPYLHPLSLSCFLEPTCAPRLGVLGTVGAQSVSDEGEIHSDVSGEEDLRRWAVQSVDMPESWDTLASLL